MKESSTMSGGGRDTDSDVMMETEEVSNKSKLAAPVSEDHVDEMEGRDDWNGNNRGDGTDGGREDSSTTKTTKPSPARKARSGGSGGSSQNRRYQQDAYQGQQFQGRGGPYPHPAHPGGPRSHPNPPPYPHPPYGFAPGPAGAPHDPYRGGPPPPPPHYHQGPPLPHPGQYGAPHGAPYHPGSAYHPMSGPNYRVPQYPPSSHPYGGSHFHNGPPQGVYPAASDSSSIASSKSKASVERKSSKASNKGPSKKRTITGVHSEGGNPDLTVYPFRRTGSNASTSSTVTAGNNTSTETPYLTEDSPQRTRSRGSELPPLSSANLFEDADQLNQMQHHRRNHSAASTASSLSVGGFSLSSYDRLRGTGGDGAATTHEDSNIMKASPKKRKSSGSSLTAIDTGSHHRRATSNSSNSIDVAGAPSRFQKLSMEDGSSKPPSGAAASHKRENSARNLFLTMSTSPINCDVEATPNIKNTKKSGNPSDSSNDTNSFDRGGDTPTPTEAMAERDMMTNEHMLNQHLRSQSFTPLSHLANSSENGRESISNSPANNQAFPGIAPQLSWSIAGDAPSLADLTDWEEEIQNSKSSEHKRDNSFVSKGSSGTKGLAVSPQEFGMWKEEEDGAGETTTQRGVLSPNSEMNEDSANPESTPLPVFFGHPVSGEERENLMKTNPRYITSNETEKGEDFYRNQSRIHYQDSSSARQVQPQFGDAEHIHQLFLSNGGRGSSSKGNQPFRQSSWSSEYGRKSADAHHMQLPPTPVYSEHRDESFGRSPLNSDGRDGPQNFFVSNMFGPGSGLRGHNDRVRNLRGRVPHHNPMQLQIPQQTISHHHNLTSPMGIGSSGKSGMWGHPGGIHPPVPSPHHMPPIDINSSKRKCMPLKPPIPSKFQGDIEKMKTAKVPEFANLVNFPNHMSQKQSVNLPEGMRCCVMCGQACPCSSGNKNKKKGEKGGKMSDGGLAPRNSNGQDAKEKQSSGYAIIPTQNKGLCTLCDVNVWVVTQSGLEIKWCKGCKNFRPWAAFGDKGLATKCLRCRERQREKYALQKEEKERARLLSKGMAKPMAKSKA